MYNIIAVDFDATITDYKGWKGIGEFGDVLPGAKEALTELKANGKKIIIFTTRGEESYVHDYLIKKNIPFDLINVNAEGVPKNLNYKKVIADVYVDDRAISFGGSWNGVVDKINTFIPWYKRENKRPSINLTVCGYHADQIALFTKNPSSVIDGYKKSGHKNWIIDKVTAKSQLNNKEFVVNLAFNYSVLPCEFEIISVEEGETVQITSLLNEGLSHYGFHVENIETAIKKFSKEGYNIMDDVVTLNHSGCQYKFRYVFFDTRKDYGFISKLIIRL